MYNLYGGSALSTIRHKSTNVKGNEKCKHRQYKFFNQIYINFILIFMMIFILNVLFFKQSLVGVCTGIF